MKQYSSKFRVLVPTAMFGSVRVSQGDVVTRELLGCNTLRLISKGIVEPILPVSSTPKSGRPAML